MKSTLKTIIVSFFLSLMLFSCGNANEKTVSFTVYGNCGMCKETIEKSLAKEEIYSANWDKQTKLITVAFDSLLITKSTIATMIANAGYDNEFATAPTEVYNELHMCCQYERP